MDLLRGQSITIKFTLYLLSLSTILFALVGYAYFAQKQHDYLQESKDQLKLHSSELLMFFDSRLKQHTQQSKMLVSLFTDIANNNNLKSSWDLASQHISNNVLASFFYDGQSQSFVSPSTWILPEELAYQKQTYWQSLKEKSPEPLWSDLYYDPIFHTWMLVYMQPVINDGELTGIWGSVFEVDKLISELKDKLLKFESELFIYDQDGQLVFHPDYGTRLIRNGLLLGGENDENRLVRDSVVEYIAMEKKDGEVYSFIDWGKSVYAVNNKVSSNGWSIVNYQTESEIFKRSSSDLSAIALMSIMGMVCVGITSFLLSRSLVSNRLRQTSRAISRASNGHLDQLKEERGSDEIDAVYRHLNELFQKFNKRLKLKDDDIKKLKDKLDENKALAQAVSFSDSAVLILDLDYTVSFVDSKVMKLLNCERDNILETRFFTHIHQNMAFISEQIINDIRRKETWHGELVLKEKGVEKQIWVNTTITPLRNEVGHVTKYVVSLQDISFIKDSQSQIEKLAYTDELTGLANRSFFVAQLEKCIEMQKRGHFEFAVLHFDIDDFKKVNDNLGYDGGDTLLIEFASRLSQQLRGEDVLARLSGDEFAFIVVATNSEQNVLLKVNSVLNVVSQPFVVKDKEIKITTSIGITMSNSDDPNLLLQHADLAMYEAKNKGKNTFHFYTKELNDVVQERMTVEVALEKALNNDKLELYYQPKVDFVNQRLVGYEALLRWHDDSLGFVSPAKFIPIAEQSDLILDISNWVMENAIKYTCRLESQVPVSINLSAKQFDKGDCVTILASLIKKYNANPGLIELEITESYLMTDVEGAITQLQSMKDLGVHISIDDFGTGYSSLSYLKRFPVDTLKIDRSFIKDIPDDNNDVEITAAIIAMARQLGLEVIAEGAETQEQIEFLRDNGCYLVQGFFFSKPLPADEARVWQFPV